MKKLIFLLLVAAVAIPQSSFALIWIYACGGGPNGYSEVRCTQNRVDTYINCINAGYSDCCYIVENPPKDIQAYAILTKSAQGNITNGKLSGTIADPSGVYFCDWAVADPKDIYTYQMKLYQASEK